MPSRPKTENYTAYDIYSWYVKKMLDANPDYWTKWDSLTRRKGIVLLMKRVNGKAVIHMSYTWFRAILEKNNMKARKAIIEGSIYNLGGRLGALAGKRVERNFSKPQVNVIATAIERRKQNNPNLPPIYYIDEDYCRIGWYKGGNVTNESIYEFKPAKDFRLEFSKAQFSNPILKFEYRYHPIGGRRNKTA